MAASRRPSAPPACPPAPSLPSRRPTRPETGPRCRSPPRTFAATLRCVTGMPAYAAAAMADVTPGTTSNGTDAAASASASSPPRPNTNGSPPLSRTTRFPAAPCSTSAALISSCDIRCPPRRLPALISSASGRVCSSSRSLMSRSCTTTSAACSSASPFAVMSPGSPGPAPTSETLPGPLMPRPPSAAPTPRPPAAAAPARRPAPPPPTRLPRPSRESTARHRRSPPCRTR